MPELLAASLQQYKEVPHTSISSNHPYGTRPDNDNDTRARKIAQDAFIQGSEAWPDLQYPCLDDPSLDASEHQYLHILDAVVASETVHNETPESSMLYRLAAYKLAEVYRHMEIRRSLGQVATRSLAHTREWAGPMSGELFGEPEPDTFYTILSQRLKNVRSCLDSEEPVRARLAAEYIELLGPYAEAQAATGKYELPELTDDTIATIRADIFEIFPGLETGLQPFSDRQGDTPPAEAKAAFEAVLEAFGLREKGWQVKITDGSAAAATRSKDKTISFGTDRSPFTPYELLTVPVHEGLHALQSQNALDQLDPIRATTMPETQAITEGMAMILQQIIGGKRPAPGQNYYMQLGILKGLHLQPEERREKNFRDLYELVWRYKALQKTELLTDEKLLAARRTGYRSVLRTLHGNARDNRDISYFIGGAKAIRFMNETAHLPKPLRQARLRWAWSGNFDPTIPEQAELFGGDPAVDHL